MSYLMTRRSRSPEGVVLRGVSLKTTHENLTVELEQGSGTYGSSGDGIWLPDNFDRLQQK